MNRRIFLRNLSIVAGAANSVFITASSRGDAIPRDGLPVALLIANGKYATLENLPAPETHAQTLSRAMREVGFAAVEIKTHLSKAQLENSVKEFARVHKAAPCRLIFYAGHGCSHNNDNYLLPTDWKYDQRVPVAVGAVSVQDIASAFSDCEGTNLLIIDACRDTLFRSDDTTIDALAIRAPDGSKGPVGQGFVKPARLPKGTALVFSTSENQTVWDNNPFSMLLAAHIQKTPNLSIKRLVDAVSKDIRRATRGQIPSLYGEVNVMEICLKRVRESCLAD